MSAFDRLLDDTNQSTACAVEHGKYARPGSIHRISGSSGIATDGHAPADRIIALDAGARLAFG